MACVLGVPECMAPVPAADRGRASPEAGRDLAIGAARRRRGLPESRPSRIGDLARGPVDHLSGSAARSRGTTSDPAARDAHDRRGTTDRLGPDVDPGDRSPSPARPLSASPRSRARAASSATTTSRASRSAWSKDGDKGDGGSDPDWQGWWPDLDLDAVRRATRGSTPHERGFERLGEPGRLVVSAQVVLPPGEVQVRLESTSPVSEAMLGDEQGEPPRREAGGPSSRSSPAESPSS